MHIVHVYKIGVLSTTITFVFAMFILRPIRLLSSDSSCCICCSYCGVTVPRNMSSAKRRLEGNYPSIFTPLFSQFNLLNMLFNVAVNSLGEIVSPVLLLSWSWFYHSLCADVMSLSCPYICLSEFLCKHLRFLVLAMMSILLAFVLSQMPARNPRKQHTMVCCIHGTTLSWFMACMWSVVEYLLLNRACSIDWFSSSFFSSLVVIIFVNSLYICYSKQTGL